MAAMLNGAGALAFAARLFGSSPGRTGARGGAGLSRTRRGRFSCPISQASARRMTIRMRAASISACRNRPAASISRARRWKASRSRWPTRAIASRAGAAALGEVGLIGGGAKSALWTRMIAAALERPVVRYRERRDRPGFRRGAARAPRQNRRGAGGAVQAACRSPTGRSPTRRLSPRSGRASNGSEASTARWRRNFAAAAERRRAVHGRAVDETEQWRGT